MEQLDVFLVALFRTAGISITNKASRCFDFSVVRVSRGPIFPFAEIPLAVHKLTIENISLTRCMGLETQFSVSIF